MRVDAAILVEILPDFVGGDGGVFLRPAQDDEAALGPVVAGHEIADAAQQVLIRPVTRQDMPAAVEDHALPSLREGVVGKAADGFDLAPPGRDLALGQRREVGQRQVVLVKLPGIAPKDHEVRLAGKEVSLRGSPRR